MMEPKVWKRGSLYDHNMAERFSTSIGVIGKPAMDRDDTVLQFSATEVASPFKDAERLWTMEMSCWYCLISSGEYIPDFEVTTGPPNISVPMLVGLSCVGLSLHSATFGEAQSQVLWMSHWLGSMGSQV